MKFMLLMVSVLVALGVGCGSRAPVQPADLQVRITGMHCESCAETITKKLRQAGGVVRSDIHFSNEVQTVHYDGARTGVDRMVAVITNLGYAVDVVAASP